MLIVCDSLWRPLKPVTNWPLALCDTRTVESQDLITTDVIRRKFIGESLYATHSQRHKWYYLSNQVPSEVTLLKIYDSADDIGSRCKWPTGGVSSSVERSTAY